MTKGIAVLGSTGSIGRQTLEICRAYPEKFSVVALSAMENVDLLEEQVRMYSPKMIVVGDQTQGRYLKQRLADLPVSVYLGNENLVLAVTHQEVSTVVTAVAGAVGLVPTLQAIEAGKDVALANKETLVAAGELVMQAVKQYNSRLIPVDSEHSAVFQCLQGNNKRDVKKIILTASGGPFRGFTRKDLRDITPKQALRHPNWEMGAKITIDSATLMNKGLEVIEAKHLFEMDYDRIEVVVHPQSIIHSMVEYQDGAILAQLGTPNMQVPIQYALSWPERWNGLKNTTLNLLQSKQLSFEAPDVEAFPALALAYEAGKIGGTMPAVLNAANEEAVEAFLKGKIDFLSITEVVARVMEAHSTIVNPDLGTILENDYAARSKTRQLIDQSS